MCLSAVKLDHSGELFWDTPSWLSVWVPVFWAWHMDLNTWICVCVCVCFLIYKNMHSLFSICDQTFVFTEYKAKLQHVKDPAFNQLWEAVFITVKIQILYSRFWIFTKGLWRTGSSETIHTFSDWRIVHTFGEWYPLPCWRWGENTR